MNPKITVSSKGKPERYVADAIKGLANAKVYVGIPEAETSRSGAVTNAGLMYIHTNGSEVMNIPARPVIEPAIEDDRKRLENLLGEVATAALDNKSALMKRNLEMVGRLGANDAKRWFTSSKNGWPRNKSATIARKLRRLKGEKRKLAFAVLDQAGETGDVSSIDTPLIDTGQLRKSITYVVEVK